MSRRIHSLKSFSMITVPKKSWCQNRALNIINVGLARLLALSSSMLISKMRFKLVRCSLDQKLCASSSPTFALSHFLASIECAFRTKWSSKSVPNTEHEFAVFKKLKN